MGQGKGGPQPVKPAPCPSRVDVPIGRGAVCAFVDAGDRPAGIAPALRPPAVELRTNALLDPVAARSAISATPTRRFGWDPLFHCGTKPVGKVDRPRPGKS